MNISDSVCLNTCRHFTLKHCRCVFVINVFHEKCVYIQKLARPAKVNVTDPTGSPSVVSIARQPVPLHDQTRRAVIRVYSSSKFSESSLNPASDHWDQGDRKHVSSMTLVQMNSGNTGAELSVAANVQRSNSLIIKHLNSNPTLMGLDMGPVMSPKSVTIESDHLCHSSKEDFICHAASECSNGTDIRYMFSETGYAATASQQTLEPVDSDMVSTNTCQTPAHILENLSSFRTHFPQRVGRPQIGIAAVIKSKVGLRQDGAAQETIKFQSPELLKLVGITPATSAPHSDEFSYTKVDRVPLQMQDNSNQKEPLSSSNVTEWVHVSISQPETPGPKTLDESIDEKWKEVRNFLRSPEYEPPVKRRKQA
ncbi:unnamed protein product, partial [Candidula unifasciata]